MPAFTAAKQAGLLVYITENLPTPEGWKAKLAFRGGLVKHQDGISANGHLYQY